MKTSDEKRTMSDAHNRFHAEKRRQRRDKAKPKRNEERPRKAIARENVDQYLMYGLHTVRAAILNPEREKKRLVATRNALQRLDVSDAQLADLSVEISEPRDLDRLVGSDAVHQGVVLEAKPLTHSGLENTTEARLLLVLDQVTDPHNVGAILRSAVALGADAVVTTSRYSPVESGVLAKAASGALDHIKHIEVRNLAEALETLKIQGIHVAGLDSEGDGAIETVEACEKIALVLGAEGKGLRQKTRSVCDQLVRLDMPGEIKSLNVSNAAVLALYIARTKLLG